MKLRNVKSDEIMRIYIHRGPTNQLVNDICYNIVVACRLWVINLTGLPFYYNKATTAASTNLDFSLLNVDPISAYKNATLPVYYQSASIPTNTKNLLYLDSEKFCFSPDGKNWSEEIELNPDIIPLPMPPVHINSKVLFLFFFLIVISFKLTNSGAQYTLFICRIRRITWLQVTILAYKGHQNLSCLLPLQQYFASNLLQTSLQSQSIIEV